MNVHVRDNLLALLAVVTPIGGSIQWPGKLSSLPSCFLVRDGSAVSRTTYATLFDILSIQQAGTRTSGSAVVTGIASTTGMQAGMPVCGTGVQSATTITTVDSGTQITMSKTASASGTSTIYVCPWGVGDGSTTFNLPDSRGKSSWGVDATGTASRLGETGGSKAHTHTGTTTANGDFQNFGAAGTNRGAQDTHTHTFTTGGANSPYVAEYHVIRAL